jgi:hypothetical protein
MSHILIGITDLSFIYADGFAMGNEARDKSVAAARAQIHSAISTWQQERRKWTNPPLVEKKSWQKRAKRC